MKTNYSINVRWLQGAASTNGSEKMQVNPMKSLSKEGLTKDESSTRLRVDYVSFTSRLRVWQEICSRIVAVFMLLLTLGVGNAWGDSKEWDFSTDGLSSKSPITLTYGQGEAANNTAVTDGTVRLYAKRSNGNGSWIKFEAASGYEITGVSVTATNNQSYARYGVDPANTNAALATSFSYTNGTATVTSLHATSFAIKNGQSSGSSNKTVYFSNITITYASTGGSSDPELTTSSTMTTLTYSNGSPVAQSFTIGGSNLTNTVRVTAPTDYEVCKTSAGTYTSYVEFTHTEVNAADKTVYIRLQSGLSAGNIASRNITVASTGADDKTIAVTGSVPYTITWSANGATHATTYVAVGGTLVLPGSDPVPNDCGCIGKAFYGWYGAGSSYSNASVAPSIAAADDAVNADKTFYAVFADRSGTSKTYQFDITPSDFNSTSYAANDNQKTTTATATDLSGATMSVKWTSSNAMLSSSNIQIKKNTGYIYNDTDLGTVNSVTITKSAGSFSTWYGTSSHPTDGAQGTGKGYFTVKETGNSETGSVSNIRINFTKSNYTYSNYTTSCCTALAPINGSISWSSATTAVVGWHNIAFADSTWSIRCKASGGSWVTKLDEDVIGSVGSGITVTTHNTTNDSCYATITGLTPCVNYDFRIVPKNKSGYCADSVTINDSQTHRYTVSYDLTNITKTSGDEYTCAAADFTAVFEAASGSALPLKSGITVTGASDFSWNQGTGTLTIDDANITGNITITMAGTCTGYSFHDGTHDNPDWQITCFSYSGNSDRQWIKDFTVRNKPNYYVGKFGSFYNSSLGNSNAKSNENGMQYMQLALDRSHGSNNQLGTNYAGVQGTLLCYDNSSSDNLYVDFLPDGYYFILDAAGTPTALPMTCTNADMTAANILSSNSVWETALQTVTDVSKKYTVGIKADAEIAGKAWQTTRYNTNENITTLKKRNSSGGFTGTLAAADVTAGTRGKYRIWADNFSTTAGEKNWYAHFVPYYRVTYDANGGSGAPSSSSDVSCEGNDAARTIAISSTEPTRAGYRFMGWATSSERATAGTVDYKYGTDDDEITLAADQTLYAVWKQLYTVTYAYGVGGSGSCEGGSYIQGETVTACSSATKEASTLDHWVRSDNSASVVKGGTFSMPASDVTLTASWVDTEYTLTQTKGSHTTSSVSATKIKSGDTSPSGKDFVYTISNIAANAGYALPKTVTLSGGGKASWTSGTDYTWELSADKHSATLTIKPTIISGNLTITVTEQARYLVEWDEHGSIDSVYYAADDNSVTLKTGIADCGTKKFYCWTENSSFVSHASEPPTAASSGTISANKHYYAIYGDRSGGVGFEKVTSVTDGATYYIATGLTSSDQGYGGQNGSNSYGTNISLSGATFNGSNVLTAFPSSVKAVTVAISNGYFSMYDGTSYLTLTSDANNINYSNSAAYVWELTASNYYIKPKDYTRWMMFNSNRFACYSNATDKSYAYLYKSAVSWTNFAKACTLYDITIDEEITGGSIAAKNQSGTTITQAGSGNTVTVSVTPNSCKYLSALSYNDGSDHDILSSKSFTMPSSDVTITATFSNKTVSSIAPATSAHRILMQGTSFVGEQITVTYNDGSTETLNANDATLSWSGYNMATLGDQTVAVSYVGTCGSAECEYDIEITDGVPITFSDAGITRTTKYEASIVVNVADTLGRYACAGWEFVGWCDSAVTNNNTVGFKPVLSLTTTTARTLYAVYTKSGALSKSARLTSELKSGARYALTYYVNNNNESYGLSALLPTVKNTNYLKGSHTGNSGMAFTKVNESSLYRYYLNAAKPSADTLWQLLPDGSGYWQLYNASQKKYLDLSGNANGYVAVSATPQGKLVIADENANPIYCNGSIIYVKHSTEEGTKRLAWNRNSGDGYWQQYTSGYTFFLTKDSIFSSTPPCAPRSVTFHGNGGIVIASGGSPTGANLEITEASRDAGINLPTASMDARDCEGNEWNFMGWIDHAVNVTSVPILSTDMLNDGYDEENPNPHYDIIGDDDEYWAVYANTGEPETKYGTINLTMSDVPKTYNVSEETLTKTVDGVGDYDFAYYQVGHASDLGIQINNDPAGYLKNTTSLGKINKISFSSFGTGSISGIKVYVGNTADAITTLLPISCLQTVDGVSSYYPDGNYQFFKIQYTSYVAVGTISIDFGQGTTVYATTPVCSTISISGTVRVTSTSGKRVKAVTPITVSATGLAASTSVTLAAYNVSDDTPNSNFTFIGSVSADANGDVSSTEVVVAYQPAATTDGIEEVYFRASATASDGSSTKQSAKLTGYGRHLPAKFVIATKIGDDWYALPNNVTTASYGTRDIIPIVVDNATTPTTATVYTSTTDYLAWGLNTAGTSTDRYTSDGEKISFVSAINSKGLAGNASGLRNSAGLPATTSSDYLLFDWTPSTTDLANYTLKNGSVTTYYVATNGSDKWTTATTGANVRFLVYDKQDAPTITWRNDMTSSDFTTNKAENGVVALPDGTPSSCNVASGFFTFDGWVTTTWSGYKTTGFTKVNGGEVATSNTTYYAVFKTSDNKYYTQCPTIYSITYTANGGEGSNYVSYTMTTTADAVTVETAGFTKEGSTFIGWTNPSDDSGAIITPGSGKLTGLSGDITLNAVWMGTVSVTGTVRLTSAEGKKVATATDGVTISSTDLACATALRITYRDVTNSITYGRSGSPTYTSSEFRLCNGSYAVADGSNIDLTGVDGEYNQTFSICYTPNGGSNTLDEYQLVVEVLLKNTVIDTQTLTLYGRTLPANFVIAAKNGNKWYALPANMTGTGNPAPAEIAVDNINNPTIAYTATTNYYSLYVSSDLQKVQLGMTNNVNESSKPFALWANNSASSTDIGKNTGLAEGSLGGNYQWLLTQTASNPASAAEYKYTISNPNNANPLKLWMAAGGVGNPKWGLYARGISELRLIPASTITFTEAYFIEWGQHGGVIEVDASNAGGTGVAAAKVKAKLNEAESELVTLSQTLTSGKDRATIYNYTVNLGDDIDFAAAASAGAMLTLEWYNSSDVQIAVSNIMVPRIIADDATMSDIESRDTYWTTQNGPTDEVHVLPGVTLTANAGSFGNNDVTIRHLEIYPGATVKVTTGTLDVTNLILRNGWTRAGGKSYDVARLYITPSTASLTTAANKVFADWYIDYDQYYPIAVPWDVTVANIIYRYCSVENTVGYDGNIRLRYYDGASRANGGSGSNWKDYGKTGNTAVPTTLKPSQGYVISAKRPLGKAFSILRMPLAIPSNTWTASGEHGEVTVEGVTTNKNKVSVTAHGVGGSAPWYAQGWNYIANPYMACFNGDDAGITDKLLEQNGGRVKYATIPSTDFKDFNQENIATMAGGLKPSSGFLVQVATTGELTFSKDNIIAPSAPTRYAYDSAIPEQEAYIRLSHDNGSDQMGLIIGDDYTAGYEINADLSKMLGEANTVKTYMRYGDMDMAYVAINEQLARELIPVIVNIPTGGEYTYSLMSSSTIDELEGLYLMDYQTGVMTNLLFDDYTFVAQAGTVIDRFAINAIVGDHKVPTGADVAGLDKDDNKPIKFVWHDKVYILHGGVIYDSTGKRVNVINK